MSEASDGTRRDDPAAPTHPDRAQGDALASHLRSASARVGALLAKLDSSLPDEGVEALGQTFAELGAAAEELDRQYGEILAGGEALRQERGRYQELFILAPDAYLVTDVAGLIEQANGAAAMLLGVPDRRLAGKPLSTYIASEERPGFRQHLLEARRAERALEWETVVAPRDGAVIPVSIRVVPARVGDRPAHALRWMLRDISARKAQERELARYRDRLEQLVLERTAELEKSRRELELRNRIQQAFLTLPGDSAFAAVLDIVREALDSPLGVFGYIDEDGALICASLPEDVWQECGVPAGQKTFRFPPDAWTGVWGQALEGWRSVRSEGPFTIPEGHVPITRVIATPIVYGDDLCGSLTLANKPSEYTEDDQRTLEAIAGIVAPILDARLARERAEAAQGRAEEEERLTAERLAFVAGHAPMILLEQDRDLRYTWVMHDLAGFADLEALGRSDQELFPGADGERLAQLKRRTLETGRDVTSEVPVDAPDGTHWFEATYVPRRDAGGETVGLIGFAYDITDRKRLEVDLAHAVADLEARNRELALLATVASHDLREPLRTVTASVQLLERRHGDAVDERGRRLMARAVNAAERLRVLAEGVLSYARTGSADLHRAQTDMERVLKRVLSDLGAAIHAKRARISSDPLPTVVADPDHMARLLQNLITNATQFPADRPLDIHVSAEARDGEWVFSVADNGIGVFPEDCERIFDLFERAAHKPGEPGTGLGLAICKRIVERHGGRIWVESEPGEGSTFRWTLPQPDLGVPDDDVGEPGDARPVDRGQRS